MTFTSRKIIIGKRYLRFQGPVWNRDRFFFSYRDKDGFRFWDFGPFRLYKGVVR